MTIADLSEIQGRTYPARRRTQNLVGGLPSPRTGSLPPPPFRRKTVPHLLWRKTIMQTLHATSAKDATFLITKGHFGGFTAINLQILGDLGVRIQEDRK